MSALWIYNHYNNSCFYVLWFTSYLRRIKYRTYSHKFCMRIYSCPYIYYDTFEQSKKILKQQTRTINKLGAKDPNIGSRKRHSLCLCKSISFFFFFFFWNWNEIEIAQKNAHEGNQTLWVILHAIGVCAWNSYFSTQFSDTLKPVCLPKPYYQ